MKNFNPPPTAKEKLNALRVSINEAKQTFFAANADNICLSKAKRLIEICNYIDVSDDGTNIIYCRIRHGDGFNYPEKIKTYI